MSPYFSIVIPTYNRADRLNKTINSVLAQTFSDFEMLIMDDGSTDHTQELIESFNDSRLIYSWEKNFGGPSRPRNRGIKQAKGEWICFLDADDWWKTTKLQICFEHLNDEVDFLYHDMVISHDGVGGLKKIKSRKLVPPIYKDLLLGGNVIINSSVMVRKKILEEVHGIDESSEMIAAEDFNAWLRIGKITNNFLYLPVVLGYYLEHDQNISQKNMSIPERVAVADFIVELEDKERLQLEARLHFIEGKFMYLAGIYTQAKVNFFYCIRNGHFLVKIKASIYLLMNIFGRYVNSITK